MRSMLEVRAATVMPTVMPATEVHAVPGADFCFLIMASSKKVINIVGAGTYGVFLAFQINRLARQSNVNIELNVHERGPSIIPGWRSISIADVRLNNGFHGLEMPRAFNSYQILEELIGERVNLAVVDPPERYERDALE